MSIHILFYLAISMTLLEEEVMLLGMLNKTLKMAVCQECHLADFVKGGEFPFHHSRYGPQKK